MIFKGFIVLPLACCPFAAAKASSTRHADDLIVVIPLAFHIGADQAYCKRRGNEKVRHKFEISGCHFMASSLRSHVFLPPSSALQRVFVASIDNYYATHELVGDHFGTECRANVRNVIFSSKKSGCHS